MNTISNQSRNRLRTLRPEIPSIDLAASSNPVEYFQNETLRPLLKFQNEILIAAFEQYAEDKKSKLSSIDSAERAVFINTSFKKDQQLRQFFLGILVGQFTLEEYRVYTSLQKDIRKRAIDMLIQRLQDQLS